MGSPEEAGQPPRSPSAAPDEPSDQSQDLSADALYTPPDSVDRWRLTDDDVAELEQQVTEEDVPPSTSDDVLHGIRRRHHEDLRRRIDGEDDPRELRRRQEQVWADEVRGTDFTGPVFEIYWDELMRYGLAVMMSWTRTGKIIKKCREKGRPVKYPTRGPSRWSYEDRLSLAGETVAKALTFFLEEVLRPGKWTYEGGAALRTYFVGACLLQFTNIFNQCAGKDEREAIHTVDVTVDDAEELISRNVCWWDPTGEAVAAQDEAQRILADIEDPETRKLVEMVALDGMKQKDAAMALGMTPGAAWARLNRLKQKAEQERETR